MVKDDNVLFLTDNVEYIRKSQGKELSGQSLAVVGD